MNGRHRNAEMGGNNPTHPNTEPHCNATPLSTSGLARVSCSLVKSAWKHYLADYPNKAFVATILHIIEFGAALRYTSAEHEQSCCNLRSAFEHPQVVSEYITSLCTLSCAQGPFSHLPLPNFHCSPLSTILLK